MAEYEVVLLPAAFSDLDEIVTFIAADSPAAPHCVLDDIMQSLQRLNRHPHSGPLLFERSLTRFHFRTLVVSPYIAFYRVIGNTVFVYRVLHGARDYPHLLRETI